MGYITSFRLIDCLKRGLPAEIDVYDAADWSARTPLSASVATIGSHDRSAAKLPGF